MKKSYLIILCVILVTILTIIGCSKSSTNNGTDGSKPQKDTSTPSTETAPPKSASSDEVTIKDFAFDPSPINAKKGATVKWSNEDSTTHTVTGDNFDSGDLSPGKTFEQTFDKTGTFKYYCNIHSSMTGEVVVE